jgi:hypothetical protein
MKEQDQRSIEHMCSSLLHLLTAESGTKRTFLSS